MKSVTKREIAILVAVFVAMPFALWGAITVIDLFLPTSHSDMIAKRWPAGQSITVETSRSQTPRSWWNQVPQQPPKSWWSYSN